MGNWALSKWLYSPPPSPRPLSNGHRGAFFFGPHFFICFFTLPKWAKKCTNHPGKCSDPSKTRICTFGCAKKVLQTIRASLYTHTHTHTHIWKQHILKRGFPMTAGQGVQAKVDRGFWDHHFLKMNSVHWTLTRIAFFAIKRELQYFCCYEAPQNILKSRRQCQTCNSRRNKNY